MNTLTTYDELVNALNEVCNCWFMYTDDQGEIVIKTGLQWSNNGIELEPWIRPCTATKEELGG